MGVCAVAGLGGGGAVASAFAAVQPSARRSLVKEQLARRGLLEGHAMRLDRHGIAKWTHVEMERGTYLHVLEAAHAPLQLLPLLLHLVEGRLGGVEQGLTAGQGLAQRGHWFHTDITLASKFLKATLRGSRWLYEDPPSCSRAAVLVTSAPPVVSPASADGCCCDARTRSSSDTSTSICSFCSARQEEEGA